MLVDWGMQQDTKAYIQGKIKGLITSVKSFQYKRRIEYELYVYIDDGSYISEAFVDNDIVKNMLGLTPGELAAALAGESELASASEIKETMKGFQRFLVKFEGTMLVEFNKNSSIPIVRELSEGCSSSDAWLLLRRLKTFSSERHMQNLDIMDTTP
uniref:RecQ-mediated genome instability protein 1 C-terminal OB-fold domain-containing protein n=1 Tax=Arundo donax TaxID=35708 RepID=A0A0A9CVJ9_ARUDO